MTQERRHSLLRRDLNDLVREPSGKVAEAKAFAVAFKIAMLYIFIKHFDSVLKDAMTLLVFCAAFLAPDLLKKMISMRTPKADKQ